MNAGPLAYDVVGHRRTGSERVHRYATGDPLGPGSVVRLDGRWWLVEQVDAERTPPRAEAKPARYRIELHHPDGLVEVGAFRRYRTDAPRLGHSFTTLEDGHPVGWEVLEEQLGRDEQGEPFLELIAERDYGELEELPDHELEHALASRADRLPEAAADLLARAGGADLIELVALDPGELPDWDAARQYIDDLILEEIEDDLLEQCGVDPDRDPRETWIDTVRERLRADLESFRDDVEGDQDEIEEWDFLDGRIFATVGTLEDESDPNSSHGWLCRLLDAGALAAAGFVRVRKRELEVTE